MALEDNGTWPIDDIYEMIAEMRSHPTSPHWDQVRRHVYKYASWYGKGSQRCTTDAEDITQEVMLILVTPGKLEDFGKTIDTEAVKAQVGPVLRRAFLAWLKTITYRRWQNYHRYVRARPHLKSQVPVVQVDSDEISLDIENPDPQGDIADTVEWRMLLEEVVEFLASLQKQDAANARKVAQLVHVTAGMSYEEVAHHFNCKPTQIRDAIYSIRTQLQRYLATHEDRAIADDTVASDALHPPRPKRPKRPTISPGSRPRLHRQAGLSTGKDATQLSPVWGDGLTSMDMMVLPRQATDITMAQPPRKVVEGGTE